MASSTLGKARIIYNNIELNFNRELSMIEVTKIVKRDRSISNSNVLVTQPFYQKDIVRIRLDLLSRLNEREVLQFMRFALDGGTFSFERDINIGFAIDFEGKMLETNNQTVGVTDRTGAAFTIDPSTKLFTSIASATPRFFLGAFEREAAPAPDNHTDKTPFTRSGVVVDRARTQIIEQSNAFTGAGWASTNATVVTNITYFDDLSGTNLADEVTATSAAGFVEYTTSVAIGADDGVGSVYVRSLDGPVTGSISLRSTTAGQLAFSNYTTTSEWQLISVQFVGTSPGGDWVLRIDIDNNTQVVVMFDAEITPDARAVGTPNPGIGATGVINKEFHTFENQSKEFDRLRGTFSFWVFPFFVWDDDTNRFFLRIRNQSSNIDFLRFRKSAQNTISVVMPLADNSSVGFSLTTSASVLFTREWNFLAITYDTTVASAQIYHGVQFEPTATLTQLATSTSNTFSPIETPDQLVLGTNVNETLGGAIDEISMYPGLIKTEDQIRAEFNTNQPASISRSKWQKMALMDDKYRLIQKDKGSAYLWSADFEEVV